MVVLLLLLSPDLSFLNPWKENHVEDVLRVLKECVNGTRLLLVLFSSSLMAPMTRGEVDGAATVLKPNINIPGIFAAHSQQRRHTHAHTHSSVFTFLKRDNRPIQPGLMLCQVVFLFYFFLSLFTSHCCCTAKDAFTRRVAVARCLGR